MTIDELIVKISQSSRHKHLYHFTDESNFNRINEKGLLSKDRMRAEGWWPQKTGGDPLSQKLDTKKGIDSYVSLCFTQNHGMNYLAQKDGRLPNPRYLQISPDVLKISGTRIALGVANGADVEILPVAKAIERLDIEVIYDRTNWSKPAIQQRLQDAEKFEILILDAVPRDLIKGVI